MMTNDEIRIAVAKAKGWREISLSTRTPPTPGLECYIDSENKTHPLYQWATDIAAAWELEYGIPPDQVERYVLELTRIINAKEDFSTSQRWQLIHATPQERCLAWLASKEAHK